MFVIQLMHVKNIDSTEDLSNNISLGEGLTQPLKSQPQENADISRDKLKTSKFKNQLKNTEQIKSNIANSPELKSDTLNKLEIKSFEDLINVANKNKEMDLKFDLERNVKLVNFSKGKINITFNEKLNKNFIKVLTEKLLKWTGERWLISLSKEEGAKTYYEKTISEKQNKIIEEKKSSISKEIEALFPDAKLVDVTEEFND